VISANVRRRHLDAAARRRHIKAVLKADPTKSDREVGRLTKTNNKHYDELLPDIPTAGSTVLD
jgi:hypothetical protein